MMGVKKNIFFLYSSLVEFIQKKNTTFSAKNKKLTLRLNTKENKIKIKSEIKYLSKEVVELW